ncbi:MAG: DMT family transporter [Chloroflexota bacterium]|nr:MAG: DMT family transporter [Chloroflexota bacterium]
MASVSAHTPPLGRADRPGHCVRGRHSGPDGRFRSGQRRDRPRPSRPPAPGDHRPGVSRSHRGAHRPDGWQDADGDLGVRTGWRRTRLVARGRSQPRRGGGRHLADRCGPAAAQSPPAAWRSSHHDLRSSGGSLTAVLLALAASLSWGVGDFVGGFKTRRLGTLAVLFISQPPTLLLIAAVVIIRGVPLVPGPWIAAGVVAGLAGLVGLSAVYRGMAIGVVGVVSTIAATGPVIPILVGLVLGERPSVLQFVGILVTLAGIGLLAFDRRPQSGGKLVPGVGLALLAALAFGIFLVAIKYASRPDPLWGVLATRTGSVSALLLLGLAFRSRIRVQRTDMLPLLTVGVLDVSADVFFAFATTIGLLSIVSILSSLYPVATVILARIVLKERMLRLQQVGIGLALAGVLLISL